LEIDLAIYNYGTSRYASRYNHGKKNNESNENEFYKRDNNQAGYNQ
jgi:hypothetical protein